MSETCGNRFYAGGSQELGIKPEWIGEPCILKPGHPEQHDDGKGARWGNPAAPDSRPALDPQRTCTMCKGSGKMPGHFDVEAYLDSEAQPAASRGAQAREAHWISELRCLHERGQDQAFCACGWSGTLQFSVGAAVATWWRHVDKVAAQPSQESLREALRAVMPYAIIYAQKPEGEGDYYECPICNYEDHDAKSKTEMKHYNNCPLFDVLASTAPAGGAGSEHQIHVDEQDSVKGPDTSHLPILRLPHRGGAAGSEAQLRKLITKFRSTTPWSTSKNVGMDEFLDAADQLEAALQQPTEGNSGS